ncbi:hypothetical protein BDBG_09251 [Blastomyces gilchristii SLH14081]|uniref:Uncharacterized protein n=1 Tax=Blastomyces gilchristii (strain SLH14081) TaxID=559298 RepID=A0A179V426_BLAGS|nr:uncharacterized protein BDBG_09251 [Blastomyces gilchristii SLH14081]OAT14177.1 hypothetical protein BDBG_09251 [Blastomyces gilchristii SLH14081]
MSTLSSPFPSCPAASLFSPFSIHPPPAKKQRKMSLTQTYFLAHTARAKLSREASRPDHDLRILVGHANMLDSLMLELADAEREQEKWFNRSVQGATERLSQEELQQQRRHIKWADALVEEPEDDWDPEDLSSDSDSDSDDSDGYDEEDIFSSSLLSRSYQQPQQQELQMEFRIPSTPLITTREILRYADEEEAIEEDDEGDSDELALTRTHSRSQQQPPELLDDSDDSSSEDESVPSTPPQPTLDSFSEKAAVVTTELYATEKQSEPPKFATLSSSPASEQTAALFEDGFFLPHQQEGRTMIEAF